jgi:hypothetical protein
MEDMIFHKEAINLFRKSGKTVSMFYSLVTNGKIQSLELFNEPKRYSKSDIEKYVKSIKKGE